MKGGENNTKAKGKNARTPLQKKQNKEHSHGMDVKWRPGYWRNTVIIVSAVVSLNCSTPSEAVLCAANQAHIILSIRPSASQHGSSLDNSF